MSEFAEQEIILPDGPYQGERFNFDRQPYSRLYLKEIDSGRWSRFVAVGPSQSGKTLIGSNLPVLYHLFEIGENVIYGIPDMEMAADKWRKNILPCINSSRYRIFLPPSGSGSRGGKIESIQFTNGATLKFMSAGGDDKNRSGYTSRVIVLTEVDGYDMAGDTSREADPVSQFEARTEAFGERAVVYMECTASIESGRIWQEYTKSTMSRIAVKCPLCGEYVTPDRDNLIGWQDAKNKKEAKDNGHFFCPECKRRWTEDNRYEANLGAKLIHALGWENNDTFGMRWSAVNNMFKTAGEIAVKEWVAKNAENEENSEKRLRQFVWALPYIPDVSEITSLDSRVIEQRITSLNRGICPKTSKWVTVGVDLGKRLGHWMAIAWDEYFNGQIIDYGRFDIASDHLGVELATLNALRDFRDAISSGWVGDGSKTMRAAQIWMDSGWAESAPAVYAFCRESGDAIFRPTKGHGAVSDITKWYKHPKNVGGNIRYLGEQYHFALLKDHAILLVEINADYWKSFIHNRLATEIGSGAAITLFSSPDRNEHKSLAKHMTAETKYEEYIPGKGLVTKWKSISRSNHWFDCSYISAAAAHFCGARIAVNDTYKSLAQDVNIPKNVGIYKKSHSGGLKMPDGRPFCILNRK